MNHILIVDDDAEIRSLLRRYLESQGCRVSAAADRRECEAQLEALAPDLVVLDVMLPDGSGLEICRSLVETRPQLRIILLTALKEDIDRIIGLELGADDYLSKPFNPRELVARIKANLRRATLDEPPAPDGRRYDFAGFCLDPQRRLLSTAAGTEIELTAAEFDLLRVFLDRPGRVLSRDQLLDLTEGRARDPLNRSIDALVSRLRRKLGEHSGGPLFHTVRNGGYQLAVPVEIAG